MFSLLNGAERFCRIGGSVRWGAGCWVPGDSRSLECESSAEFATELVSTKNKIMGIWLFISSWNVPGSGTVPLSTCVADLTVGGFCFELCNEVSSLERLLPVIGALVGKMGGLFANLSINKERGILSTTIGRTHNMDKKLSIMK